MATWYTQEMSFERFSKKINNMFGWWLEGYPQGKYELAPLVVAASVSVIRRLAIDIPTCLNGCADFVQCGDGVDNRNIDVFKLVEEKRSLKQNNITGRPQCLIYVATTPADIEESKVAYFTERPSHYLPAIALIVGGAVEWDRFMRNVIKTNPSHCRLTGETIYIED
jgi:hypothetical protein